tara:strand:- start:474 stop:1013 length:540 start_codon:yes stop_codon:yes gene_type:complete
MKNSLNYIGKWLFVQTGLAVLFGLFPLLMPTQDADAYVSYSSMLSFNSNFLSTAGAAAVIYFILLFIVSRYRGGLLEETLYKCESILSQGVSIVSGGFKMFFWWHFSLLSLVFFGTLEIDPWFQSVQALKALGFAFTIDFLFAYVSPKGGFKAQYSGRSPDVRYRPIKDVHRNKLDGYR